MAMRGRAARLLAAAGTLGTGLALSACMPITYADTATYGDVVQQAPVPAWADIAGFDDYEWIDRADAIAQTVGDAPPDLSFAFAGGMPSAWTLEDGTLLLIEQQGDGLHAYYFEAGADEPFLVRDPTMSFGFIGSAVAVVYGADGGLLDRTTGDVWLVTAMRGYERGRMLRAAMLARDEVQQPVVEVASWIDWSVFLYSWQRDWDEGCKRHDGWRRHRDGDRATRWRQHLNGERQRRELIADQFRRWRSNGFQGPSPGHWRRPDGPGPGGPGRPDRPMRPGRPGGRPGGAPGAGPGAVIPVATPPAILPGGAPGADGTIDVPAEAKPVRPPRPTRPGWNGTRPPGTPPARPGRPTRPGTTPPAAVVPPAPPAPPIAVAPPAPVPAEAVGVPPPPPSRPVFTRPSRQPGRVPPPEGASRPGYSPSPPPVRTFAPPLRNFSPPPSAPPVRNFSPPASAPPVRSFSPPPTVRISPPPPPPPVRVAPPPPPSPPPPPKTFDRVDRVD